MKKGDHILYLNESFNILRSRYNDLRLIESSISKFEIEGILDLNAKYNDISLHLCYNIKIDIPKTYPDEPPTVFEIGGVIPHDFHKNSDSALCLGIPSVIASSHKTDPSLLYFVEELVVPFLYSYSYSLAYGKMPFGELSHGPKGIIEYYKDKFATDNENHLLGLLRILVDTNYRGHLKCPCSSNLILRKCHGKILLSIMNTTPLYSIEIEYLTIIFYMRNVNSALVTPDVVSKNWKNLYEKHKNVFHI